MASQRVCPKVDLDSLEDEVLQNKKSDAARFWMWEMVSRTSKYTRGQNAQYNDTVLNDVTLDQKVTIETLTRSVRMWNISASGRMPIALDVRKRLKKCGEMNLDADERRLLRYSLLVSYHQRKVLKVFFGTDRIFTIRELANLKNWLGTDITEEEFVTGINQKRLSCAYIANIANSLKHLTYFLEAKATESEVVRIAKQIRKVCCRIANGFSKKKRYNVQLRNMLEEERDKLVDLKLLNEKFLNGDKHFGTWQLVQEWINSKGSKKLSSAEIYRIIADLTVGLSLETGKRPTVISSLRIRHIKDAKREETDDGIYYVINVVPKIPYIKFKTEVVSTIRLRESFYKLVDVVAEIRLTEDDTNHESTFLRTSRRNSCLYGINCLFKQALKDCGFDAKHFTSTNIRRTMVTLLHESEGKSSNDVVSLAISMEHSIKTAFGTYCNKHEIARKSVNQYGNAHRKILDQQDWNYEIMKSYEDEADVMMTVIDFSKVDDALSGSDDINMLTRKGR